LSNGAGQAMANHPAADNVIGYTIVTPSFLLRLVRAESLEKVLNKDRSRRYNKD